MLAELEDVFKKGEVKEFRHYIDNLKQSYGEDYTYFSDNIIIIKTKKGSFGALGIKRNSAFANLFFRFKDYSYHRKELNKIIKRIEYTRDLNNKQIDILNDRMDKENKDLNKFVDKRLEKDNLYRKYLYRLKM